MASKCHRFITRTSISNIKSSIKSSLSSTPRPSTSLPRSTSSPIPRFNFSRIPSELAVAQSLLPLYSAVATARMTSCLSTSSRSFIALSQDEIDGT